MRKYLVLFICLFISLPNFGQKLSIGLETGFISSLNTTQGNKDFENNRNTFFTGFTLDYQINNKLSIQSGIQYLRQGYQHSTCYIYPESIENKLIGELDYVALPLTAKLSIGKNNRFFVFLGGYGAYNINARQRYPDPLGGCQIYYPSNIRDNVYDAHFGAIAGVGFKLIDNDNLTLDANAKYYHSLGGINDYGDNRSLILDLSLKVKLDL